MAVNKVVYGDQTLIDLTGDTVTPETLMAGEIAHNAAGVRIVGTASGSQGTNFGNGINQISTYELAFRGEWSSAYNRFGM